VQNFVPFLLIPFIGWGVSHHLLKRGEYTKLKQCTLGVGITAYFFTEMARSFYRPYIYAHGIDDWVIADTIGNSLGTVTAVFMILTLAGRGNSKDWLLVGLVLTGLITFELLNPFSNRALDLDDIFATVVFGALSIGIYAPILGRLGTRGDARQAASPDLPAGKSDLGRD
jgi:hypothetical protein